MLGEMYYTLAKSLTTLTTATSISTTPILRSNQISFESGTALDPIKIDCGQSNNTRPMIPGIPTLINNIDRFPLPTNKNYGIARSWAIPLDCWSGYNFNDHPALDWKP